jgi:hypothetical protein
VCVCVCVCVYIFVIHTVPWKIWWENLTYDLMWGSHALDTFHHLFLLLDF